MERIKVLSVFGTRPETIKMAPLLRLLAGLPELDSRICFTGQHRDLPAAALELFGLRPDYDLAVMQQRQTPAAVTCRILSGLEPVLAAAEPDLVLVHGDTATTLAAALAAFYHRIPVGHVEAGLRSGDRLSPWPEEMDRTLTADLAALHFCPTAQNRRNLEREAVQGRCFVTGNTGIDALRSTVRPGHVFAEPALRELDFRGKKVLVLTCHRRENQGPALEGILAAVGQLARAHEELEIVYPVHPSPAVRESALRLLAGLPRLHLTEPLDPLDMHNLLARCHFVLTDSGGLQEEAPALGKPVLVLRDTTERPEALRLGNVKLAGTDPAGILAAAEELLGDTGAYERMARAASPYGDGHASKRIAGALLWHFGLRPEPPADFEGEA